MRTTIFAMEEVEGRQLMSAVIMSQFPAICVPLSQAARQQPPSGGPSSGPSAGPSAGPKLSRIPTAPTGVAATPAGADSIDISWNPVAANVDTIVVDYSTDGVNYSTLAMLDNDATTFRADSLGAGTYSFKLWAMNAKGTSPASDVVSAALS